MSTVVPVLETERLTLRAHRADDLDGFAGLWAEQETTRFTSGRPLEREEAWRKMACHRGMWELMGFGYFAVIDKASGAFIGDAGVQEARRAMEPSLEGTLEAGWIFAAASHGKGYAREAMEAVFAWCADAHPGRAITCIVDEGNAASLRLAGRLGFGEIGRSRYKDRANIVFRRD